MAGGAKVKVRKVSLSVNSPSRRKVSKTNTKPNKGLNALPPFQWSKGGNNNNDERTASKNGNNNTNDLILMPPPIVTRSLKNPGIRNLAAQYAEVSNRHKKL